MKQQIANYTVVIEKQKRMGTKRTCYMAFVPTLGIATDADTIEKAEKEIKSLLQFHLDSLAEEGEEIPVETGSALVTRSQVLIPKMQ
jgi:predicted RNase H-like HicB family nuclease